jgi:hypothetical protein
VSLSHPELIEIDAALIEDRPADVPLSGLLTVVMPVRGQDPTAALVAMTGTVEAFDRELTHR